MKPVPKYTKIIYVTGKGGVGKSLTSIALAKKLSSEGLSVNLVELGNHSYFKNFFRLKSDIGQKGVFLKNWGFTVSSWSPLECLKEYIQYLLKIRLLANFIWDFKIVQFLIRGAPTLGELAITGKMTSGAPRLHGPPLPFDVLVIDGFSTGHTLSLFKVPFVFRNQFTSGPLFRETEGITVSLMNDKIFQMCVVTNPEELVVIETKEFIEELKKFFSPKYQLIINRVIPYPGPKGQGSATELLSLWADLEKRQRNCMKDLEVLSAVSDLKIPRFYEVDSHVLAEKMKSCISTSFL